MKRKAKEPRSLAERTVGVFKRLKRLRGLSEVEKTLQALGLAATPTERWELNRIMARKMTPAERRCWEEEACASAVQHERLSGIH